MRKKFSQELFDENDSGEKGNEHCNDEQHDVVPGAVQKGGGRMVVVGSGTKPI